MIKGMIKTRNQYLVVYKKNKFNLQFKTDVSSGILSVFKDVATCVLDDAGEWVEKSPFVFPVEHS